MLPRDHQTIIIANNNQYARKMARQILPNHVRFIVDKERYRRVHTSVKIDFKPMKHSESKEEALFKLIEEHPEQRIIIFVNSWKSK